MRIARLSRLLKLYVILFNCHDHGNGVITERQQRVLTLIEKETKRG